MHLFQPKFRINMHSIALKPKKHKVRTLEMLWDTWFIIRGPVDPDLRAIEKSAEMELFGHFVATYSTLKWKKSIFSIFWGSA